MFLDSNKNRINSIMVNIFLSNYPSCDISDTFVNHIAWNILTQRNKRQYVCPFKEQKHHPLCKPKT